MISCISYTLIHNLEFPIILVQLPHPGGEVKLDFTR
jgi:hypothetical protein